MGGGGNLRSLTLSLWVPKGLLFVVVWLDDVPDIAIQNM